MTETCTYKIITEGNEYLIEADCFYIEDGLVYFLCRPTETLVGFMLLSDIVGVIKCQPEAKE